MSFLTLLFFINSLFLQWKAVISPITARVITISSARTMLYTLQALETLLKKEMNLAHALGNNNICIIILTFLFNNFVMLKQCPV